jgi:hypothetical protein
MSSSEELEDSLDALQQSPESSRSAAVGLGRERRRGPGPLSSTASLRDGDFEVLADLAGQEIVDFPVSRDRGALPGGSVHVDGMAAALTKQLTAMTLEMP